MKSTGKIVVMFISLFVLSAIFWFINLENGGEGISAIGLFITIGFSWFISYSKWANDNIWSTKTSKPNNTPNTSSEKVVEPIDDNKTPKEVNQNLNPNNNNTLLYVIIGLLVAILVVVVVRSPESQQTNSNKRETIQRETVPRNNLDSPDESNEYYGSYEYYYVYPNGDNIWSQNLLFDNEEKILVAKRRAGEYQLRTEHSVNGVIYSLETWKTVVNRKAEEEEGYNLYTLFKRNPNIKIIHKE
mgnify:CR=1 FL=1|tara:strand:+ start:2421 stop:3152 length:732 start_codon:yes stop_codon:yes gene_type:complete